MTRAEAAKLKEFVNSHECDLCLYYDFSHICYENNVCYMRLVEEEENDYGIKSQRKCSKDTSGDCPYPNLSGTCFGFCLKKILKEHMERKQKRVQSEEEENE